ncbi:protein fuzzy homolog [Paramacrobiotus metropolitanus]|uniref:protein fuzzy homolog n=1 Tax=Paramacrobiotus metropolitanus TaxID=2943436 RepID=UPI0024457B68|nr:protein fuzzy homolog [Paramacrobiotus metropolitanus]
MVSNASQYGSHEKMSGCLYGFAQNGGLLVFSRTYGEFHQLPVPMVASLNGVHDYLAEEQTELLSFEASGMVYVWRQCECLKFILVTNVIFPDGEKRDIALLLDFVWLILVASVGEKTLNACQDVDVLRRYCAHSAQNIDVVMDAFLGCEDFGLAISLGSALFAFPSGPANLRNAVDSFCADLSISHCAILINDRIAMLSTGLSSFSSSDLILLALNAVTTPTADIIFERPLFFPHFSPNLAYRLVVVRLASTVSVAFLAGADFHLDATVQGRIDAFWRNEVELVRRLVELVPKYLPAAVEQQLPQSLLGLLLWNTESRRYLISPVWPAVTVERTKERRKDLIKFYRMVEYLLRKSAELKSPPVRDVYRNFEERKCYCICRGNYHLYAMFDAGEPQHSLRHICEIILTLCTKRNSAQLL